MNAEEELKILKQRMLKRSRITATVFGVVVVIAVIFLIYGITQSVEAAKQSTMAMQQRDRAIKQEIEAAILQDQLKICQAGKIR